MDTLLTYEDWIESMEEKVARLPRVQAAISNFQVLPRLGKLLSVKSKDCPDCRLYWKRLQESTLHLEEFFKDGNSYSVNFEDLVDEIMRHLKFNHQIRPKGYLLSIYTVVGMVVGLVLSATLTFLINQQAMKAGLILGWLIGMLVGWFIGKYKEDKLRKNHQLF